MRRMLWNQLLGCVAKELVGQVEQIVPRFEILRNVVLQQEERIAWTSHKTAPLELAEVLKGNSKHN